MRKKKKNVYVVEKETPEEKVENYVEKEHKELPNPLQGVNFWLLCCACALLVVMGIWIIVDTYVGDNTLGPRLVMGFTGFVICVFAVIRVVPLVRTQKSTNSKMVILTEIILDIVVGAFLFYGAFSIEAGKESAISDFCNKYYNYLVGGVLYLKGVFYFITTSLLNEVTNKKEFWLHVLIMSIGVIICSFKNLNAGALGLFIAIISLLSGVAAGGAAGGSYFKYRKNVVLPKKAEKEKQENKEEETNDEANILPSDNDDNRPYVS